ncbi:MAG: MBL fold metallo-hydrolase [Clostridia bacterium]|nr:MBL fold metallo-hydrolase [Clostridia bacterium]
MLEGIEVLCHSSIRMNRGKVIYIDPYKIQQNYNDADIIFITHNHYDHYSKEDIDKVKKAETIIVATEDLFDRLLKDGFSEDKIKIIVSNNVYKMDDITFEAVPAYNTNKLFHPKKNGWVGYILEIEGIRYYIAGDTDITEENKKVKCNVAFVPVGGTYTMNAKEAAELVNTIKPEIAVPIHYGSVVGTKKDPEKFIKLLSPEIEGVILMK